MIGRLLQRGLRGLARERGLVRGGVRADICEAERILRARELSRVARGPAANFGELGAVVVEEFVNGHAGEFDEMLRRNSAGKSRSLVRRGGLGMTTMRGRDGRCAGILQRRNRGALRLRLCGGAICGGVD